jgi:hypothetical protein
MMPASHLLLTLAAGLGLSASLAFTALTARVDYQVQRSRDPDTTARACLLMPLHASCLATLARQREELGFDSAGDWLRASQREPRDSRLALQAAFSQESAGRLGPAEALLLESSRLDRGWAPRWSLASFYYRHQKWPEFWNWARQAAAIAPVEPAALYRLCLAAEPDPGKAADGCLGASTARLLPSFFSFVAREDPGLELGPLTSRLVAPPERGQAPQARLLLLSAAESLLRAGAGGSAHTLWRRMGEQGLLPYRTWTSAAPLTNGELGSPLDPPAFDWRIYRLEGLETLAGAPPGSLKFTFSGTQAESIPLIEQWVWTADRSGWELACQFRAPALEPGPAALAWRWLDRAGRVEFTSPAPSPSPDWTSWSVQIPAGLSPGLHKLVLWASRPSGQTRLSGEAWVRQIDMRARERGAS